MAESQLQASAAVGTPVVEAGAEERPHSSALIHGIAWTGAVKWAVQVVTWISTIVVARLLTPEDYGLVGMATIYMGLVTYLSEFGIGTTIISLRDLTEDQIAQLNSVAVALGAAGVASTLIMAAPLAAFFNAPQLRPVVMVLSAGFAVTSVAAVPMALLQRDLRFKQLALIDGAKAILTSLAMVLFALLGFRYWTLVIGSLLGAALSTALILLARRSAFARPSRATLRRPLRYTQQIIAGRLAWYWYSTSDFLVAGRMLGKGALGAYTIAWDLSHMIPSKVADVVSRVTPSFFSAVQDDKPALRRYLVILSGGIALVIFPATVGLAVVAGDFVTVVLGEKWSYAVLPLRFLAFYAAIRSITPLLHHVLVVTGQESFDKWTAYLSAVFLPIAFVIGSRWGGAGIAAAWLLVHPPILGLVFHRTFRTIGLRASEYLEGIKPALVGTLVMSGCVLFAQSMYPSPESTLLKLLVLIATGILAYSAVLFAFYRDRLVALRTIFQTLRARA